MVLADYPRNWSCLRINCSYFSNGPVGMTSNDWTKNPQYLFTVSKQMSVRIFLRKAAPSFEDKETGKDSVYGFLLFDNRDASNMIQCMKMDTLIAKTMSSSLNEASFSGELRQGNYILIPYCTEQS